MPRWSTHVRRAASLLLGVHLLQVVLLAASAVCDLSAAAAPSASAGSVKALAVHDDHTHGASHAHHAPQSPAPDTPATDAPHHTSHTTSCPMAMACVATAIVVPVPSLASREIRVSAPRIAHEAERLRSMHPTPEPPPPRG